MKNTIRIVRNTLNDALESDNWNDYYVALEGTIKKGGRLVITDNNDENESEIDRLDVFYTHFQKK